MSDEPRRPPRPEPREDEVVFVPEEGAPITQRAAPQAPRLHSRPVLRAVPGAIEAQYTAIQQHLGKMALQQDHVSSVINQRFDLFHEELALTRHDVAETAKKLDELAELVKDNHGPRLAKVETTAAAAAKVGGKYGGLVLLGSVVAELFPQWGQLIRAVLQAGGP